MSILRPAGPQDAQRLWAMIEDGAAPGAPDAQTRQSALQELLGTPEMGKIYLVGPTQAPVGFLALSFGFSVMHGGKTAAIDQIFIRQRVRGRGLGGQILSALPAALSEQGIRHLSAVVSTTDEATLRFFQKAGFTPCDGLDLLERRL